MASQQRTPQGLSQPERGTALNGHAAEHARIPVPNEKTMSTLPASASSGDAKKTLRRSKRRKEDGLFASVRSWTVEHQIGLALNLVILHALAHLCFPRLRQRTRSFITLSYFDSSVNSYRRGPEDLYFVAYALVVFMGLRVCIMHYILMPAAEKVGCKTLKQKTRFAEQAWLLCWHPASFVLGTYIMYNSPYWLNFQQLWIDFPHILVDGLTKWYYLVEFAFWLQQIVTVNIEERRKDHWQMFTHHIITCALILCSYGYYQTRIGNIILLLMDFVDIWLSGAKVLKYMGLQTLCDGMLGMFVVSWFACRHVLYNMVCWSIYADVPKYIFYGRYSSITGAKLSDSLEDGNPGAKEILYNVLQPYLRPGEDFYYNEKIRWGFIGLLVGLQVIFIVWFSLIAKLAWKVVAKGEAADDERSDDEGGDEADCEDDVEEDWDEEVKKSPIVVDVKKKMYLTQPAAQPPIIGFQRRPSPVNRVSRRKPGAGPVNLADRKELLGRIGCDKPT